MESAQQVFVVPSGIFWAVRVSGNIISSHYGQPEATNAARTWLRSNGGGELFVLGSTGQVRQRDMIYAVRAPAGGRA